MRDHIKRTAFVAAMLVAQPALAEQCPALSDQSAIKDRLHAQLLASQSEMAGRAINDQIWMIWTTAPDERSQTLLDLGRERLRVADYDGAEAMFNDLIAYCPDYAEGWNQRAFSHFLRQDYSASLDDITKVLELEPRHFGALAGRATTLISMGRVKVGHTALREALKVNPWLSERHLLPPGQDI